MKRRRLILGLIAVPIVYVVAMLALNLYREYVAPDLFEKTKRDTRRMLGDYERTGDARELRGMLAYPPDAAGGTVAMMTIGEWAITHQKDFISIIDGLYPGEDREVFSEVFTGALSQSSLGDQFQAAFRDYHSPVLDQLMGYRLP